MNRKKRSNLIFLCYYSFTYSNSKEIGRLIYSRYTRDARTLHKFTSLSPLRRLRFKLYFKLILITVLLIWQTIFCYFHLNQTNEFFSKSSISPKYYDKKLKLFVSPNQIHRPMIPAIERLHVFDIPTNNSTDNSKTPEHID